MTCSKCGSESASGAPFCSTCGTSLQIGGVMPPIPPQVIGERTSGMAIAGFVLAFVCGLLGLIFSAMGYSECKKSGGTIKGQGLALAGLIISIVSMGLAVIGILAAIAIPSFIGYQQKAKKSEAALELHNLERRAKAHFHERAEFPKGSVPLTPARSACSEMSASGKIQPSHEDWAHPVWQALDFQMDRPHLFQYSYESDGRTFTAKAVGDLDCDGTTVTYELQGSSVEGNPSAILIEPPPNSD